MNGVPKRVFAKPGGDVVVPRHQINSSPSSTTVAAATKLRVDDLIRRMTQIGFASWSVIRDDELYSGHPFPYLAMIRYMIVPETTPFPLTIASLLRRYPWFVVEKNDEKFLASVMRLFKTEFSYRSAIRVDQFLRLGQFVGLKIAFTSDVAAALHGNERGLVRRRASSSSSPSTVSNADAHYRGRKFIDDEAKSRWIEAQRQAFKEAHRALNRLPRLRSSSQEVQRELQGAQQKEQDESRSRFGCWYCAYPRPPTDDRCIQCGSAPVHLLHRAPLNETNVSAATSVDQASGREP